jgi:hypothetical protein
MQTDQHGRGWIQTDSRALLQQSHCALYSNLVTVVTNAISKIDIAVAEGAAAIVINVSTK